MDSRRSLVLLAFAAACASTAGSPPRAYWDKPGATGADFATSNDHCGAVATRSTPTPRADQISGGSVAPENRIDRPHRPYVSAAAERAYMDCMASEGWRPIP